MPWPHALIRHEQFQLDGDRVLGFTEWGAEDGDLVFWMHGTPGGARQVPPDAPALAHERGFRLVGIDRPGTGLSSRHHYETVRCITDDVAALADELGADQFAVVGLSGGGPFVLSCAHDMPHRVTSAAVLGGIGPVAGRERAPGYTQLLGLFSPLLGRVREPLGDALSAAIGGITQYASPAFELYKRVGPQCDRAVMDSAEMKEMFLHDLVTAADRGLRAPIHDLALFARPWGFSLCDIAVPVTFWHGDADTIVPHSHGEHQSRLIPGARLITKPGEGHFAGFTVAAEVLESIDDDWSGRPNRPAPRRRAKPRKASPVSAPDAKR